jgi:dienelactone hydrolase
MEGDIASGLVEGADRFLLRELELSEERRARHWQRDFTSPANYTASVAANRARLAHRLGLREPRVAFSAPELLATTERSALIARGSSVEVLGVRWPAVEGVYGEGLLLLPSGVPVADLVVLPDASQTPEQLAGLVDTDHRCSPLALRLAQRGCRILAPSIVDRQLEPRGGRSTLTTREFLYRAAFELGRHLLGYELQKVLAAVDWFAAERTGRGDARRIGVAGWGDGGMLALYAVALDPRIDAALVSGHFTDRRGAWQEPLDRNVFGLLEEFGDAELASLVAPRALVVEAARGPELELLPGGGGAPARLVSPSVTDVVREVERARSLTAQLSSPPSLRLVVAEQGYGAAGSEAAIASFLHAFAPGHPVAPAVPAPELVAPLPDAAERLARQVREIDQHTQRMLVESPYTRAEFMRGLDTTSPETYAATSAEYRRRFSEEVIGRFDLPLLPPAPCTRLIYETPLWTGYEVVLDVFPDLIAYGILLLPKGMQPDERRPVVVCQHGLEGRPQEVVTGDSPYYHDFAAKLAEQGYITFAPQNLYLFGDRFRTLQRKANLLGKTLFSLITPQHQQILNWLKTLPNVDPARIAFYGLSYGGKTAMRVPALLTDYCLSICSADFNEWVWKNASTRSPYSYVWSGEYEIFEFGLGETFNYAEMAALIAPRPFMVERGHFDGVAPDETVAYEYAKVQNLYATRLGLSDHCEIEWFVGPHTINGEGTFRFLHRHLGWSGQ